MFGDGFATFPSSGHSSEAEEQLEFKALGAAQSHRKPAAFLFEGATSKQPTSLIIGRGRPGCQPGVKGVSLPRKPGVVTTVDTTPGSSDSLDEVSSSNFADTRRRKRHAVTESFPKSETGSGSRFAKSKEDNVPPEPSQRNPRDTAWSLEAEAKRQKPAGRGLSLFERIAPVEKGLAESQNISVNGTASGGKGRGRLISGLTGVTGSTLTRVGMGRASKLVFDKHAAKADSCETKICSPTSASSSGLQVAASKPFAMQTTPEESNHIPRGKEHRKGLVSLFGNPDSGSSDTDSSSRRTSLLSASVGRAENQQKKVSILGRGRPIKKDESLKTPGVSERTPEKVVGQDREKVGLFRDLTIKKDESKTPPGVSDRTPDNVVGQDREKVGLFRDLTIKKSKTPPGVSGRTPEKVVGQDREKISLFKDLCRPDPDATSQDSNHTQENYVKAEAFADANTGEYCFGKLKSTSIRVN